MRELKAYIDRFARPEEKDAFIRIGSYSLHTIAEVLYHRATPVKHLSPHEFNALLLLAQNRNEIVPYETLSEKVWGKKHSQTEASMNNVISRLRKLLTNDSDVRILTRKNHGYKLVYGNI